MLLDRRPDVFLARRSGAEGLAGQAARPPAPAPGRHRPPRRRHLRRRFVHRPCPCWWAPDPSSQAGHATDELIRHPVSTRQETAASSRHAPPAPPPRGAAPRTTDGRRPHQSARDAEASEQERIIIEALADLRDMDVREVMTPRVDVTFLTIPVQADDIARAVRTSGHSCFPVVHDDLDDLIGILFVNDIFRTRRRTARGRRRHRPEPAGDLPQGAPALPRPRVARRARGPGRHAQAPPCRRRGGRRVRRGGRDADGQGPPRAAGGRPARRVRRRRGADASSGSTAPAGSSTARPTSTRSASAWASTCPTASTSPWAACSSSASATSRPRASRSAWATGTSGWSRWTSAGWPRWWPPHVGHPTDGPDPRGIGRTPEAKVAGLLPPGGGRAVAQLG